MPSIRTPLAFVALALAAGPLAAQGRAGNTAGYHTAARLAASIDSVARANRGFITVSTLATSPGNRPVQLVQLGTADRADRKPALLVIAGAYGPQLASSEVALRVIRELAARRSTDASLYEDHVIYVIPRLNPDASEAFFSTPRAERVGNDEATDADRDHVTDEDAPDDLNGDGLITMMRVRVAGGGEYLPDSIDPALLRRADAAKGDRGTYMLYVEGRDDDGDGEYNEDGPGGTDLSRNFAHNYEFFTAGSPLHPFSADETRAVAEFVATHDNIAAVYVLGTQDNLVKPWVGRRVSGIGGSPQGTSQGGPLTAIMPAENPWFAELSRRFEATPKSNLPESSSELAGDPLSWAYYHMARFAVGSRVWWPGKAPADTAAGRKAPSSDPIAEERNAYRWFKANDPSGFIEWAPVSGYTIDGNPVEVGGFAPGARLNPSAAVLDSLGAKQAEWVAELAGMLPSVSLAPVTVTAVGPRVWRLKATIANDGFLPTNTALGVRSRLPMRVKVELRLADGQSLGSGEILQFVNALEGSGSTEEFEWLVVGDAGSTVTLEVGAPNAGLATQTITLRAR